MSGYAFDVPAVWAFTGEPWYNQMRAGGYDAWLTPEQQLRCERVRQARMLFDGRHREYFLDEGRTQHPFPPIAVHGGRTIVPYVVVNLTQLVCLKTADMVFGQEPRLDVTDDVQRAHLAALSDRSSLDRLFYTACLECSYEGEGFFEACRLDGEVYVQSVPAHEIFPVGDRMPDGQYRRYVRYRVKDLGTPRSPNRRLLETWYQPGEVRNTLWQLDENGKKLAEIAIEGWPVEDGETPPVASLPTGIAENTVTWVYNQLNRGRPASLVDRLVPLQDAVNAKQTQIDRILAKHADPKLWLPRAAADAQGNVRATMDAFYGDDKTRDMPEYIPLQVQVEAAERSKKEAVSLFCLTAEISPSLLGLKEGAAPDAAKKLRLEATNTVSMAQRVASNWKPAIKRTVGVAQALEQTTRGTRYVVGPIAAKMRDGLPIDTLDQATEIATLRGAGSMSVERSVRLQIEDEAEAGAEIARIDQAKAEATPSILLGGGFGGTGEPGEGAVGGGQSVVGGESGGIA